MSEAAFDCFAAAALQVLAVVALHAMTVVGDRYSLCVRSLAPVLLGLPLRFGDVGLAAKAE